MLQSFLMKGGVSQSQLLSWPSGISVCFCTPSFVLERRSAWDWHSTEVSLELSDHVTCVMGRGAAGAAVHGCPRVYMMAMQIVHPLCDGCIQPCPLHPPESSVSLSKAKLDMCLPSWLWNKGNIICSPERNKGELTWLWVSPVRAGACRGAWRWLQYLKLILSMSMFWCEASDMW